jgi:hypothetical protein
VELVELEGLEPLATARLAVATAAAAAAQWLRQRVQREVAVPELPGP